MKKIIYVLSVLVMVLGLSITAKADELTLADRIVDDANLLSESETEDLLNDIEDIIDDYDFDVVIYTTEDASLGEARDAADDFFDYNGYGMGKDHDGILFYINMETRDFWFSTTGYGIEAFTDYGIEFLTDECKGDLSDGDYYDAFASYIYFTEEFLEEADENKPYDTNNAYLTDEEKATALRNRILISVIAALVIAGIVIMVMISKMKTAVPQMYAKEYIKKDSFHLTNSRDLYLYSTTTRTAIPKSTSSGGSSSHSGSSGSSHGGGGGSF